METVQYVGIDPSQHIQVIADKVELQLFERLKRYLDEQQPNRYLTADQVCERFSVTKPTIHEWRKRKILKSYKLGSRVYYRLDEIESAMINGDEKPNNRSKERSEYLAKKFPK